MNKRPRGRPPVAGGFERAFFSLPVDVQAAGLMFIETYMEWAPTHCGRCRLPLGPGERTICMETVEPVEGWPVRMSVMLSHVACADAERAAEGWVERDQAAVH